MERAAVLMGMSKELGFFISLYCYKLRALIPKWGRQLCQQSSALKSLRLPLLHLSLGLQTKLLVMGGYWSISGAQNISEQGGCGSGCSLVTAIDPFGSSLQALLCLNDKKIDLLGINFLNYIIFPSNLSWNLLLQPPQGPLAPINFSLYLLLKIHNLVILFLFNWKRTE